MKNIETLRAYTNTERLCDSPMSADESEKGRIKSLRRKRRQNCESTGKRADERRVIDV